MAARRLLFEVGKDPDYEANLPTMIADLVIALEAIMEICELKLNSEHVVTP